MFAWIGTLLSHRPRLVSGQTVRHREHLQDHAENFKDDKHLEAIIAEAQQLASKVLAGGQDQPGIVSWIAWCSGAPGSSDATRPA